MTEVERGITGVVLLVGLLIFVVLAWRKRADSYKLRNFFVGGGSVGPELTEHNSIGLTFAWTGGIWFFTILAYQNGPWVLFLQLPWCFSIILLALLFRRIKARIGINTIHGFLREAYSPQTQLVAALATIVGYFINMGFEVFWSSLMLAHCLGIPEQALELAIGLALLTAVYCTIGGYIANAATDKHQNILGVVALALLLVMVLADIAVPLPLRVAGGVFLIGALAYVLLCYFLPQDQRRATQKAHTAVAVGFAVTALAVTAYLIVAGSGLGSASDSVGIPDLRNTMLPIPLLVGLLSFQVVFNAIDMANWQQVAANSAISTEEVPAVRWAIIRSAMYLLWFPALGGVLLGCALRFANLESQNETIFAVAFSHVLPGFSEYARGLTLAVITLGFISTTLSTADSYIMSAAQTLSADIFFRDEYHTHSSATGSDVRAERRFVMKCRNLLIPIGVTAVLLAFALYKLYPQGPLDFQALMYAWAVTLCAPVIYALFSPANSRRKAIPIFLGLCTAQIAVSGMFFVAIFHYPAESDVRTWLINLLPLTAISIPTLALLVPGRSPPDPLAVDPTPHR